MKMWCLNIGREDLLEKCSDAVRKNYRVCDLHFSDDMKFVVVNNKTNLKVGNIPSFHIPEVPEQNVDPTPLMSEDVEALAVPGTSERKSPSCCSITVFASDQVSMELERKRPSKLNRNIFCKRRNPLLETGVKLAIDF